MTIAGGRAIPPELAKKTLKVVSKNSDFVPKFQNRFHPRDRLSPPVITEIERHPDANKFDHCIRSPTCKEKIYGFFFGS